MYIYICGFITVILMGTSDFFVDFYGGFHGTILLDGLYGKIL